jgi:hypothetical protein
MILDTRVSIFPQGATTHSMHSGKQRMVIAAEITNSTRMKEVEAAVKSNTHCVSIHPRPRYTLAATGNE